MTSGGNINNDDKVPGLFAGENVLFNNAWTFLPPGSTAQRPTPSSTINYRLRFNTDEQLYEYYDAVQAAWTQLQESTFTQGPFITYTADASIPDAQNLGALANGILKQTITSGIATLDIALNGTDYYGPGFVIPPTSGGTGVNNGASTLTLAGSLSTIGAFTAAFTFTGATGVTFPTTGTLATTSQIPTGAALTRVDDTNVTLTLGGSPLIALINAASLTLGWTGTLAETRGGTGTGTYTLGDTLYSSASNTLSKLSGNTTAVKQYLSQTGDGVNSAAPAWATISGGDITGAALSKTDDTNVTLTLGGTPTTALLRAASLTLGWTGLLSIARGGTGVGSVTTSPTATAWAGWDANLNLSANNFIAGYATTATAAANTTLTVGSASSQFFTGSTTQTVTMPVASTLTTGHHFYVVNNSSGSVTVNSSGGNAIQVMAAGTTCNLTCILNSGTSAASWYAEYAFQSGSSTGTVNSGSINQLAWYAANGTAVSGLSTANSGVLVTSAGGVPSISSTLPAFTTSSITFNPTTGGIVGTTTNDNAAAGKVGEIIESTVSGGATIALSTGITADVTFINLTPGDWDVWGMATFSPNGSTTSINYNVAINTASVSFPALPGGGAYVVLNGIPVSAGGIISMPSGATRITVANATTQNVYLVVNVAFAGSTMSVYGYIGARRRR